MAKKRRGAAVDGLLLLDKPRGASSNRALQQAKRLLDAQKAGHTGNLDPIATGLLLLCFGETTKISECFLRADKDYWVQIKLGVATDTGDRDGRAGDARPVAFDEAKLQAALAKFRGPIQQVPPMYSALKKDGQPLYKLARKGITVERPAREVTVHSLTLEAWDGDSLTLQLSCSHGFYVRTLAHDLGEMLGCGAHVCALRRTAVGGFSVEESMTLPQLEAVESATARRGLLLSTEHALKDLPRLDLPDNLAGYLLRGQIVRAPADAGAVAGMARAYSPANGFMGLADVSADGKVRLRRKFRSA